MHYCRKLTFFEDSFTVLTLLRSGFHFRYEDVDGLDKLIMETQARTIRAITSNYRLMLYVQEESILTPARDAQTAIKILYGTSIKKLREMIFGKWTERHQARKAEG